MPAKLLAALDKDWTIYEYIVDRSKMRFQETIFTLGNGYLGSRGILEEGYSESYAGTYLAGVYDKSEGASFEIVNLPNPLVMELWVDGKELSLNDMKVVKHQRILDIKRALLLRRTIFRDAGGRRYEYESIRFFSLSEIHTGVMTVSFKSLDSNVEVVAKCAIDGTTRNEVQPAGIRPIKHYTIANKSVTKDDTLYLETKTNDLGIVIGMATAVDIKGTRPVSSKFFRDKESVVKEFSFPARRRKKYTFNRYISTYTSRDTKNVKQICLKELKKARRYGIGRLLKRQVKAWDHRWQYSDFQIEGDPSAQKAIRFDIYHLLISASIEDIDTSIAVKGLSGEWYKGHIFWDTETYVLPFFIYTQPHIARNHLMYRYRRLPQAQKGARAQGYKGALWPWESAASGMDETPKKWVNFDGTVIPVYNSKREHHIAGDVIYALAHYYQVTKDEKFMLSYGAEMVFETARFWASRVTYNKKSNQYEIREIIGPNEFQECVNNNSYTNALARWVLKYAFQLYSRLQEKYPHKLRIIERRIGLKEREVDTWGKIAEKIIFLIHSNGLIEEFESYLDRKNVTIDKRDKNDMPVWPARISLAKVKHTQLVKQADVILLLHLFSDKFSRNTKRVNLDFYEKRTTHKSSLSLTSYAIIALELGKVEKAYKYFTRTVNSDLKDIYGNTDHGMHLAALGGAWQIGLQGFAGIKVKDNVISVNPILPRHWKGMKFRIWFRGALIEFIISRNKTKVFMLQNQVKRRKGMDIEIYGRRYFLTRARGINAFRR